MSRDCERNAPISTRITLGVTMRGFRSLFRPTQVLRLFFVIRGPTVIMSKASGESPNGHGGSLYICGVVVDDWSPEVPEFSGHCGYDAAAGAWS